MNGYLAADGETVNEIVINRSRFICTVSYVKDFDDAQNFVRRVKKQYSTATHNCYAYISNAAGTEQRFSDDGEPQGTAGQPMLEVLKKRNLCCTAVVVTRYFGGVKLGAGGLVSAYTRAVAETLDKANIFEYKLSNVLNLTCSYTSFQTLQNALKQYNIVTLSTDYGDEVKISLAVPTDISADLTAKITDALCGTIFVETVDGSYYKYSI